VGFEANLEEAEDDETAAEEEVGLSLTSSSLVSLPLSDWRVASFSAFSLSALYLK